MSSSAAAFVATEAIRSGEWDQYIDQLAAAARARQRILRDRSQPPPKTRAMIDSGHQVWVWMGGALIPHWEVMGTGAVVPEELRRQRPTDG